MLTRNSLTHAIRHADRGLAAAPVANVPGNAAGMFFVAAAVTKPWQSPEAVVSLM